MQLANQVPFEAGAIYASLAFAVGATLTLIFVLVRGGSIATESHWGGLGGQVSGWRISNGLLLVVVAGAAWLVTVGLVTMATSAEHDALKSQAQAAASAQPQAAAPAAKAGPGDLGALGLPKVPATASAPAPAKGENERAAQ